MAGIYAFNGEKELAYQNLGKFNQDNFYSFWLINLAKNDPMFNNIRDEPRFQELIQSLENKNRVKREEVSAWLEENDMLN